MRRMLKKLQDNRGITLVEILIGSLMSLIIAASLMEFYISQHNQWITQEKISDMQQNSRAVLEELTRQIRWAGFGISLQPYYQIKGDTLLLFTKPGANVDTIRFTLTIPIPYIPIWSRKWTPIRPSFSLKTFPRLVLLN